MRQQLRISLEGNPMVVACREASSHGDGAGAEADVPAPGRQLPQAKPGWRLGRGPMHNRVFPASRSGSVRLVSRPRSSPCTANPGLMLRKRILRGKGAFARLYRSGKCKPAYLQSTRCFDAGDRQRWLFLTTSAASGPPDAQWSLFDSRCCSLKRRARAEERVLLAQPI